ncbi:E3 ubiquitin-protein ligase TM129 [Bicyclus anynana]|uniref:E3 ubiquitin-protein ligase TM129 n=1 Tax=Bicyclus anynana TaxID=110368 RepID=A0A6J1N921_BICAN|nr:E3 ubiquitin-protein ligase TM129 [Bicyclus anynana]
MDVVVTLFYILFSICVVYPPTEFISAGFTIPQLLESFLGSENTNFVGYHMRRVSITALIHSALPFGYALTLWCSGVRGEWMPCFMIGSAIGPLFMMFKIACWWEGLRHNHPVVKAILPYVPPGLDWRMLAVDINLEFRGVDKVSIQLNATNKFIATERWLIKVSQYAIYLVKQNDCALVATATDSHNFSVSGEDEVQYLNIEVIPSQSNVKRFTFRISTSALRDLQPRLERPVRVPDHISLLPTLIERFVLVFKQHIERNPVYIVEQELEVCIGCMQNTADVKLNKLCPPGLPVDNKPPCQQCNCRVLWCGSCMGRWWAARAPGAPADWLAARGSCPVCRATFCLLDVCPARRPAS